jgi:ketosteroid isomerase-like protein
MTSPALQVALAYHRAWTGKDLDAAMTHVADDIVCDAPAGQLRGVAAFREFLEPFAVQFLIRAELIATFGDDNVALIMYDTETVPVSSAPTAEYVEVRDGKIVYDRFIFDRTPFQEFRQRQASVPS